MEETQGVEVGSYPNYPSVREREEVEGKEKHLHPEGLLSLIKNFIDTTVHTKFGFCLPAGRQGMRNSE
jgi:hypothetical protein